MRALYSAFGSCSLEIFFCEQRGAVDGRLMVEQPTNREHPSNGIHP